MYFNIQKHKIGLYSSFCELVVWYWFINNEWLKAMLAAISGTGDQDSESNNLSWSVGGSHASKDAIYR